MKCWWTKELTVIQKARNRISALKYKWRGLPEHPSHEEYRSITKKYARAIEKAKADHWSEWIKHIGGDDIWSIHNYMRANPTDYGKQRIPNIMKADGTYACTNSDKAQCLAETFFPPVQPPLPDKHQFKEKHPPTTHESSFPRFTTERVAEMLSRVNPYKAPGPLGISNSILKCCANILAPHLADIYQAICDLHHYPERFTNIHQIVLPKPGHPSYEVLNAYHPIALIETIVKVQSTIITENLSYECKHHNLLPDLQFGGCPGRSTTDALHYVEQYIKNAWRRNEVVSALFLNIQAAFPNMQKDCLIANMKARNIAIEYHNYVDLILTQCNIQLRFDDHTSQPFSPPNGCCQGCPLSMLLYVIYNTPLLQVANPASPNECIVGFIDNTTLLARGKNFKEAHATLKDMMEHTNRVFEWSSTFNLPLEMNKLALVNFTQSATKARDVTCLTLMQPDHSIIHKHDIEVSLSTKLLGVILDARLNWSAQHE